MNEDHPQQDPPQDASHPGVAPNVGPSVAPGGDGDLSDDAVNSKKILCGVLAIVLGTFGVHKFILGYTTPAIIMLVASLVGYVTGFLLCIPLLAPLAMWIIGVIEGIIYLTKSNEEFRNTYLIGKKEWF